MFAERLNNLKAEFVAFASLIEEMVLKAINGLLNKENKYFEEVIASDEPRANRYELEIDEACVSIIAQFEPKAKDLRTILMIFQMNTDLERLGDKAVNICESGLFLSERPQITAINELLKSIEEEALKMFKDSVSAFMDENVELATTVFKREPVVNRLRDTILAEVVEYIKSNPLSIEQGFHIVRISRAMERIADLSTNICEDVTYLVTGRVVKHSGINQ